MKFKHKDHVSNMVLVYTQYVVYKLSSFFIAALIHIKYGLSRLTDPSSLYNPLNPGPALPVGPMKKIEKKETTT